MSFATEVAAFKSSGNKGGTGTAAEVPVAAPEAAVAAPAVAAVAEAAPVAAPHQPKHGETYDESKFSFNDGLPAGIAPVDPKAAEAAKAAEAKPAAAAAPAAPAVEAAAKAPIKIGGQEFQTIDEAVDYARKLEAASLADKAYIEGLKDGKPEADKPKVKTAAEIFAEKVFEDPLKAAQDFQEATKAEIRAEYNQSLQTQAQIKAVGEARKEAWDTFYRENTDLSEPATRDILENYLLKKLTDDGKLKPTDKPEKLAELARAHLKIVKEAAKPVTELPAGPVTTAGASGEATSAATTAETAEPVDFVSQMNNFRASKKKKV